MEILSTWSLSGVKSRFCTAFNKPDGSFLIPLPRKLLRKLLLLVLRTAVTQQLQSVISLCLGESKIWRLNSQPTMPKNEGIFAYGRQEPSSVDNSSGWDKHPMIEGFSSVGPPIFPPITLLQPLTRKEMQ